MRRALILLALILVLTVCLVYQVRHLRLGTSLTDLLGNESPKAITDYVQNFGFGNQLFVIIQANGPVDDQHAEQMEELADLLIERMIDSGHFRYARASVREDEMLRFAELYAWNFPYLIDRGRLEQLQRQISPEEVMRTVREAGSNLVSPFSTLGTNYFLADPLGISRIASPAGGGAVSEVLNFDLEWGRGNLFYSKDHSCLLLVSEPKRPVMDYEFAESIVGWSQQEIDRALNRPGGASDRLKVSLAGAYVFAAQDRKLIQSDIVLVSLISVIGNLAFGLLVYRRISVYLMTFVPISLSIAWTAGLVGLYPGTINMISLSFIAILMGIGDDHVIHFLKRLTEESDNSEDIDKAIRTTIRTTGKSIVFCIGVAGTAMAILATSSFQGFAELGWILGIGLLMLLLHILTTLPVMARIWWTVFPPRAPGRAAFRYLPSVIRVCTRIVLASPRLVLVGSGLAVLLALLSLSGIQFETVVRMDRDESGEAIRGQKLLEAKFGIEGSPQIILIEGSQETVLERAESLSGELERLRKQGVIRSVIWPSQILPSFGTQRARSDSVSREWINQTARALRSSLVANGYNAEYFGDYVRRLEDLGRGRGELLDVERLSSHLPSGMLRNNIQRTGGNRYLAAIAVYGIDSDQPDAIPPETLSALKERFGPFTEFSYASINRSLQRKVSADSRRVLVLTFVGVILIALVCFRRAGCTALAFLPTGFGLIASLGALALCGHSFTLISVIALPLVIGIGIDDGIHFTRRLMETPDADIAEVCNSSGLALLLSNLTTLLGFGALVFSQFQPLRELGVVITAGIGATVVGSLVVFPAFVKWLGFKPGTLAGN